MAGATPAKVNTRNGANLHLRSGPGLSYSILYKMPQDSQISVSQILPKTADGYVWCRVQYEPTKGKYVNGYACKTEPGISFDYIRLIKDPESVPTSTDKNTSNSSSAKSDSSIGFNPNLNFGSTDVAMTEGEEYSRGSSVARENQKHSVTGIGEDLYLTGVGDISGMKSNIKINRYKEPEYVQNAKGYPPVAGRDNQGIYIYKYATDHSGIESRLKEISKYNNISTASNYQAFISTTENYSRYKIPSRSNKLVKSYAHVFFTRPDLNILKTTGKNIELVDSLKHNAEFFYALKHSPELLTSLVHKNGDNHDFLFLLANRVNSLQISDEYIKTDTYGDGWTGYKVPYGKHNIESRTSGTLDIGFSDDRDLHVYHLHKIWTDYINMVYRGIIKSKDEYIMKKILDYASSIYYILTAEDNETIIFWSKYYGVFPTNSPSSVTSWQKGDMLSMPSYSVQYQYAWKRDFDPLALVEFNYHTRPNSGNKYKYLKTYIKNNLGTGPSMAGAPFIESIINKDVGSVGNPYTFKLRFMPRNE